MKLEQAARQALEALKLFGTDDMAYIKSEKAITALREALAEQAEQEPVAYIYKESSPETGEFVFAAPVRTKDLTDDEIFKTNKTELPDCQDLVDFARAVIAADREKNRGAA